MKYFINKMVYKRILQYIPIRSSVLLFILWANSSYAPTFRNVGFYCNDESIKQPFHGDSVHFLWLFAVLLGFFPLTIHVTHILSKKSKNDDEYPKGHFRFLLRNYYTGFLFVLGLTEVLKLSYCELRPHFISTCQPDMENIKCSDGFITEFNCTGKGRSSLLGRDAYKSFPSGHASLSVFSFVFLNIYLLSRMENMPNTVMYRWWIRSIPVISFLWTVICCVSRIFDNRHFWWDVLVGSLIGLMGGFLTVRTVLKKASQKKNISSTS